MTRAAVSPAVPIPKSGSGTLILGLLLALVVLEILAQFGQVVRLSNATVAILSVSLALLILLLHGTQALGWRNLVAYLVVTVVISFAAEAIGVATGLVFGPYHYTDLFGPRLLGVPPLIQAAYAAMGYASLMIARLLLRMREAPTRLASILAVTLLGAMIMVAWDVGMDPYQSTVSGIWIWHTGGGYFGVGLHNYIGWFGTVFCFLLVYHLYAVRFAEQPSQALKNSPIFWSIPALLYAAFALGNITPIWIPSVSLPYASPDNYKGTPEALAQSLGLVSIFVMGIPVVGSLLVLWRERFAAE